jgi:6-phosphogluconolactonase
MRYLAIDYGGKRTGLALCDKAEMIASPLAVVENQSALIPRVLDVIRTEHIEGIILGLPLNMDGSEGRAARAVRDFAKELVSHVSISIIFQDERLSSFEAEEKLAATDFTRKKKKKRLDAVAAAAILQSFLDKKHESAKLKPNLVVASNYEALSHKALEFFVQSAHEAIEGRGVFRTAISGGNTPRRFFELLGQSQDGLNLRWNEIHLFWVDERCVPPNSQQSNYKLADDAFLSKVCIPVQKVHRIAGESEDLEAAASDYENTIRKVFDIGQDDIPVFDLIILGMGADGHIASLFPHSTVLFEKRRLAVPAYLRGGKVSRITLTVPVLLAATRILVLVSGDEKAETLYRVLSGEQNKMQYPIHSLWPILDKITWLADTEAAKLLTTYP